MCLENNNQSKIAILVHEHYIILHVLTHLSFHNKLIKKILLSHFTNEEMEFQNLDNLSQHVSGKAEIHSQEVWPGALQSLLMFPKEEPSLNSNFL